LIYIETKNIPAFGEGGMGDWRKEIRDLEIRD